jgi:micrococcal nuclease
MSSRPAARTSPSTTGGIAPLDDAIPAGSNGTIDLSGRVSRVIDGDTVKVVSRGFETTVRLIGIDSPETRKPGTPVQCFGTEATRRAQALLSGKRVRLVGDRTQDTRDRFGRLLAYVLVDGATQSVNYQLVEGGFAKVYVYTPSGPFRHTTAFRAAESRARAARRGLWGDACRPRPRPTTTSTR